MTGRIEIPATANRPGRITINTGLNQFHYSYQFLPGATRLRVGRLVTFEVEKGKVDTAIKVCAAGQEEPDLNGPNAHAEVRYQGFEQKNDVRSFRFQAWRIGEENQEVIVTVNLALFRKYGVTIQEGPALCMRFLESELQLPRPSELRGWKRALTDKEIIAHAAHRSSSTKRRT